MTFTIEFKEVFVVLKGDGSQVHGRQLVPWYIFIRTGGGILADYAHFLGAEKKMGKANFSHLASQNILLLIFIVVVILLVPAEALTRTSVVLFFLFYVLAGSLSQNYLQKQNPYKTMS